MFLFRKMILFCILLSDKGYLCINPLVAFFCFCHEIRISDRNLESYHCCFHKSWNTDIFLVKYFKLKRHIFYALQWCIDFWWAALSLIILSTPELNQYLLLNSRKNLVGWSIRNFNHCCFFVLDKPSFRIFFKFKSSKYFLWYENIEHNLWSRMQLENWLNKIMRGKWVILNTLTLCHKENRQQNHIEGNGLF